MFARKDYPKIIITGLTRWLINVMCISIFNLDLTIWYTDASLLYEAVGQS